MTQAGPPLTVVLAGGGTTGHVAPLLALAHRLRESRPDTVIRVLGTAEGLEARLVPAQGFDLTVMPRVPLPRKPSGDLLRLPVRLRSAVSVAARAVRGADVVVGFGGYVAVPAYLAARKASVPIVVHEQNAMPGVANRLGARLTDHVALTFPGTPLAHGHHVGMPLRADIRTLDRPARREGARSRLNLDPNLTTLLVVGGSLGAAKLNAVVPQWAPELATAGVQVLHVAGQGKQVTVAEPAGTYRVVEYLDDMADAYAAADLLLCRAGAGTVAEVTALGLPAVYVPLPIGNGEQSRNAEPVVAAGGGLMVRDADLDAAWLRSHVLPLLLEEPRRAAMGRAAADFGVLDADLALAEMVFEAAGAR